MTQDIVRKTKAFNGEVRSISWLMNISLLCTSVLGSIPDLEVLKDISLSFFPGARIGVLGMNGAGKSSLPNWLAWTMDLQAKQVDSSLLLGMPQEPKLNTEKTVYENVMDGVGEVASLLEDYDQVLEAWSDPMQILKNLDLCKLRLKEKLRLREHWTFNAWLR